MKMNYELDELNECRCLNLAAKAANCTNSYPFATKLQKFCQKQFVLFVQFVVN